MLTTELFSYRIQCGVLLACLLGLPLLSSCATPVKPGSDSNPQPAPFQFLGSWQKKGDGPGKLDDPVSFAVDAPGNVYFEDTSEGFVDKFTPTGTPLLSFGDPRLRHGSGIAVDRGGAIYVGDAARRRVLIYFPNGTFLRQTRVPARSRFSGTLAVSVDYDGNLYVPDSVEARVLKFNNRGRRLKFLNAPPDAASAKQRPSEVAPAPDGSVFVAYGAAGDVRKYSSDGSLIKTWTAAEPVTGSDAITGITVTDRYVITAGPASPRIRVWTLDGVHKLDSDLGGRIDGVRAPQIAVGPNETLLVFDQTAPRLYRFKMQF